MRNTTRRSVTEARKRAFDVVDKWTLHIEYLSINGRFDEALDYAKHCQIKIYAFTDINIITDDEARGLIDGCYFAARYHI